MLFLRFFTKVNKKFSMVVGIFPLTYLLGSKKKLQKCSIFFCMRYIFFMSASKIEMRWIFGGACRKLKFFF